MGGGGGALGVGGGGYIHRRCTTRAGSRGRARGITRATTTTGTWEKMHKNKRHMQKEAQEQRVTRTRGTWKRGIRTWGTWKKLKRHKNKEAQEKEAKQQDENNIKNKRHKKKEGQEQEQETQEQEKHFAVPMEFFSHWKFGLLSARKVSSNRIALPNPN